MSAGSLKYWVNFRKFDKKVRVMIIGDRNQKLDEFYCDELFSQDVSSKTVISGISFYVEYEGDLVFSGDGKKVYIVPKEE